MASRRSRRSGRFPVRHPLARLILIAVVAAAAYWGKSSWLESPRPRAAATSATTLVERVVDGDTLVVSGGERIRLIGVDTPETKHPNKPPEPFGQDAYEFTRRLAEGKQVELRYDGSETKDRYGRTLAYVYVDGQCLNELLIRNGLARALTDYSFSPDMKLLFRDAESQAKARGRGIWAPRRSAADVGARSAAPASTLK